MGEPPASCWVLLQLRSCARAVVQCALLHVSKMTATLWRVYFCAKDCIHFSLQPLFAAWCEAWLCGWQSPAGIEHREVICSTDMRWQSQPSCAKKKHATHSSTVCFCSERCLPAHGEQLNFNCSRGQLRRTITSASLTQQMWAGVPTHTRLHWARGTVRLFCCREPVVFFGYYHVRALRDDIFLF